MTPVAANYRVTARPRTLRTFTGWKGWKGWKGEGRKGGPLNLLIQEVVFYLPQRSREGVGIWD